VQAALRPRTHRLALSLRTATGSEVRIVDVDRPGHARTLFAGPGTFGSIVWSPDGRWLLVGWPTADEFLFVRADGPPLVQAVLRVAQDFHPRAVAATAAPVPAGWCCSR
jgi:hypothetical protein